MTRLEAFFESIKGCSGRACSAKLSKASFATTKPTGEYFVGIDSGSHATKLVCINKEGSVVAEEMVPTGTKVRENAKNAYDKLLTKAGVEPKNISRITATGYGRNSIDFADEVVTEITCHALGANRMLGAGGTIVDIGGQDSKAIKIDGEGNVQKFAMNDKCAAGTGRFLEVMANKLQMSLEEFAKLAMNAGGAVSVSSMCSVFAESEVISLIASGNSKEEISLGIHQAIAARTTSLVKRADGGAPYYMCGGVAKNKALVKELSGCLGEPITVIDNPQMIGALGAAIYAAGPSLRGA